MNSTPATISVDEPLLFTKFRKLPLEIRLMIWELLVPPRVVEINHHYADDITVTPGLIQETPPLLLSVCQEARRLAINKYNSIFTNPRPTELIWEYTGSPKSVSLRQTLKTLRLPQRGTIVSMPKVIAEYMNAHPEKASEFTRFGTKSKEVFLRPITPLWYYPKNDVLLIKAPSQPWGRNLDQLWRPYGSAALKIRHIAFELDHFTHHGFRNSHSYNRSFTNRLLRLENKEHPIRFRNLANGDLETVTLVLKVDHEVITIRLDDTGILKPEQWAFEVDTNSEEFKDQMGPYWSGVTWNVYLGKEEGVALWDRLATWKWNYVLWEQDKERCFSASNYPIWYLTSQYRCPGFRVTPGRKTPLLVQGLGEKTFFGPVK